MPLIERIFHTPNQLRDNFLSRVFGIFSEEIVRCWCRDPNSPYEDLGRPTLNARHKLDFTFRRRNPPHDVYVGEMKCELELQNYAFLTLTGPDQLRHHMPQRSFQAFLQVAQAPADVPVTVQGMAQPVQGAILVWGKCTARGRTEVIGAYGLHDVLELDTMIQNLLDWHNGDYKDLLARKERWCQWLFAGLGG